MSQAVSVQLLAYETLLLGISLTSAMACCSGLGRTGVEQKDVLPPLVPGAKARSQQ